MVIRIVFICVCVCVCVCVCMCLEEKENVIIFREKFLDTMFSFQKKKKKKNGFEISFLVTQIIWRETRKFKFFFF